MKNLAVRVPVIESERGWGQKIDDYMVCLSNEDATEFCKEYNSKNIAPSAPDWYMRADDKPQAIDITDTQLKALGSTKGKRMWWSELKNI